MDYPDFNKRHAPVHFSDLVFATPTDHEDLFAFADRRRYDHLILYGPNGSAKSTTAAMIVTERQRAISAPNIMIERFNGGELNGKLDPILSRIAFLMSPSFGGDPAPYVIIEEAQRINENTAIDLRGFMDDMPVGKLIMTTNSYNTLDKGVRDRSEAFELLHPTSEQWLPRARAIMDQEGLHVSDGKLLKGLSTASRTEDIPTLRDMMRFLAELTASLK